MRQLVTASAAGHTAATVRKQGEMDDGGSPCVLFFKSRVLDHEMMSHTFRVGLLTSANLL